MSNNPRIALYREAISLEEQRSRLQADLDRLTSRLNAIQSELFDGEESSPTTSSSTVSTLRRAGGRSRRGELKAQVLSALVAAGNSGIRVKDLAAAIGTKPANIYSWFQSAPKRIPQIKKIGEAQYRLEGSLPDSALAAPAPKPTRARGRRRSTRPLSKRGELATRIIEGLKERGFRSPYLRTYVVARLNPVRFHRAKKGDTKPPMELGAALTRMTAAARKFDVASVRQGDLALVAAVSSSPDEE